jgi:fatty-acyl-CoA synthase
VAASVRVKSAVSTGDLTAFCADTLARFKVPKYVRLVQEFPLTASGKIQKYKLREEHERNLRVKREN